MVAAAVNLALSSFYLPIVRTRSPKIGFNALESHDLYMWKPADANNTFNNTKNASPGFQLAISGKNLKGIEIHNLLENYSVALSVSSDH